MKITDRCVKDDFIDRVISINSLEPDNPLLLMALELKQRRAEDRQREAAKNGL